MPDLTIRDDNDKVKEPWIGDLCTLLEWNNKYGPTDFERRRKDRVMELQGNRNPFIDEPGWINLIWGEQREFNPEVQHSPMQPDRVHQKSSSAA